MATSPHLPPTPSVVLDAPSDYAEYDELLELMAEDRRRRALDAEGRVRDVRPEDLEHYRQRIVIGCDGVSTGLLAFAQQIEGAWKSLTAVLPLLQRPSRAFRRARGRRIAQAHAYVRRAERQRTAARRAKRPVIKKGLTR